MKLPEATLLRQYAYVIIVNLCIFTGAVSLSWPSPMLVLLNDPDRTPLSRPITDNEGSWIVSVGFLCGSISNLIGGMLLDWIGRKNCLLVVAIPRFMLGFLFIFASEVWMLILARAAMMTLDGIMAITVPVYAAEIASKEQRGSLGTLVQVFTALGMLVSFSVGPFTSYVTFNVIFTCLIVVTTLPLLILPDSPYYHYSKGRIDESMKILKLIRRSDLLVQEEIDGYEKAKENKADIRKLTLLKNKVFRKSLALSLMLAFGIQAVGFMAISFYLQTILESTQVSLRSEIASVIIGVLQVIACLCSASISNIFRRKVILVFSLGGYFIGMIGLGTFFQITEADDYVITGFINYLPTLSLVLSIFCYNIGIGSLFWGIVAELFDGQSRAFGASIALFTNSFLVFLTSKYFVNITALLGPPGTYFLFSAITIVFIVSIIAFLPETKDKSFNEIQQSLDDSIHDVKKTYNTTTKLNI